VSNTPINQTTGLRRGVLNFPPAREWREDGASFTAGEQGVTVEVSQEVAVDTGNTQIECSYVLSRAEAADLHAWLGAMLS
jgi:hypothetical protein